MTNAIIALVEFAGHADSPADSANGAGVPFTLGAAVGGGAGAGGGAAVVVGAGRVVVVGGCVVVVACVVVVGGLVVVVTRVVVVRGFVVVATGRVVVVVGAATLGTVVDVRAVVAALAGALRTNLKTDPGSRVAAYFAVKHRCVITDWPTLIVASALPDPPVTLPVLTIETVPTGHRFALGPDFSVIRETVVPRPAAHVVRLTSVLKLVTDRPEPPVADDGLQPLSVAMLVEVPWSALGADPTSFVHCAEVSAEARATNGTSIIKMPPIEIAIRP